MNHLGNTFFKKHLRTGSEDDQKTQPVFDSASYVDSELALNAAAAVEEWAATDESDLDDGETLGDRFTSLFVGIADEDADGELTDDDQAIIEQAMEHAGDYLEALGVDGEDIDSLINGGDEDAAERIKDLLQAEFADMDGADCDKKATADELAFDATYKKKRVVRNGKLTWVKKRVSGAVRLSAKQKMALKKMRRKSNSSAARRKRMKSASLRKKSGL